MIKYVKIYSSNLISNVGNKDQRAIEYVLSHLSKRYRKSDESKVIIVHRKDTDSYAPVKKITLEDLLEEHEDKVVKEQAEWDAGAKILWDKLKKNGEIPQKPDGEPIKFEEVYHFQTYIEEYQKRMKENKD